jgi:choline dehydrogenase-like flavoprotein
MTTQGKDMIGKRLTASVCIVGTGPAGCTAAIFLAQQGIDVILLDGSRTKWPNPNEPVTNAYLYNDNDLLYNGETAGLMANNEPKFLILPSRSTGNSGTQERERIYGGTGTHWGGQSRPLDAVVFEKRPGFTGWPVTRKELDPYYALASTFCGLYGDYYGPNNEAGYNFTGDFWAKVTNETLPGKLDGFDFTMYQFFNDRQFQAKKIDGKTIGENPNALVILNASVLKTNTTGGAVSSVDVGVLNDDGTVAGQFIVEAKIVVMACGAVENARQLLLSGLGGDQVGRYFMAHPIGGSNAVTVSGPDLPPLGMFAFNQSLPSTVTTSSNTYAISGKWVPNHEKTVELGTSRAWFTNSGSSNFYHGTLPCAESRITLANTTDVFGQPQTRITWELATNAEANYDALTDLFKASFESAYNGSVVKVKPWSDVEDKMQINGHHLGTTRMGWTAADSVVDSNLQVHGVSGLYVAGSSVWASAGIENPTFSIITFSIRLADHLGKQLGRGGVTPIQGMPTN